MNEIRPGIILPDCQQVFPSERKTRQGQPMTLALATKTQMTYASRRPWADTAPLRQRFNAFIGDQCSPIGGDYFIVRISTNRCSTRSLWFGGFLWRVDRCLFTFFITILFLPRECENAETQKEVKNCVRIRKGICYADGDTNKIMLQRKEDYIMIEEIW